MLQFLSEYLYPTNPIALGIIWCLIGFFGVWFIGLITCWRWLRTEQKHIENNQDIQLLVTAREKQDRGREGTDQEADRENAFSEFCKESSLNRRSPIAKHLKAIFGAGWDETRLEVGELINHTTSDLFKWNNLFRSLLAVFIVIGLLGTLFGLTDSLTRLSPVLKERSANQTAIENNDLEERSANEAARANNEKMTKALSDLFNDIEGAFAPSILGIIFTVFGVMFYGFYLQNACHPVKSTLEKSTLTVWVPQLYPTTSQKLIQTLHESEAQMRRGYQTAAQVGELVGTVQSNISEFNENLTQANAITQPLSDSATQINKAASDISTAADVLNTGFTESLDKFSKEFASSVTHLTGFQDEIRNLHQAFQKDANQKLDDQTRKLSDQTQNLVKVLDTLKSYEDAYMESREQIDKTLKQFIKAATEENTSIHERNREWFENINAANHQRFSEMHSQLKTDLTEVQQTLGNELKTLTNRLVTNLENVQKVLNEELKDLNNRLEDFDTPLRETVEQIKGTFEEQLKTLNKRLENFDAPIQNAADQIRGTFQSLVTQMRTIIGDLQKETKEQNKKYEEQLAGVKSLNESVENLLKQLDESSQHHKSAVDDLNLNVSEFTKDTKDLTTAIKSFTSDSGTLRQSIAGIEEHIATLGTASQQFVEKAEKADITPLTANIERLNTAVNQISQNSRTLTGAVNTLTREMRTSGESLSIQRKFSFLERIRVLFLGKPGSKQTSKKPQPGKKQK